MKIFLATAVVMLIIWCGSSLPSSAQDSERLNIGNQFGKNPVRYASTEAFSDGRGVWLHWNTEFESKNLGFYIYRMNGGEKEIISPLIVAARVQIPGETVAAGSYSFFDRFGDANSIYLLESFNINGQRHSSQLIQTQFINDLAAITGISSEQLDYQARNAAPVFVQNESVLPEDLAAEVSANASQADPVKQRWVAAQPGVKIGVKKEGLYRVSRASLLAAGFDVSAPSNFWQLYVNGVEQSIIIGGSGDYMEFYGKGIDTLDSDTQIYFLLVGTQSGKRIGTTSRRKIGGSVLAENFSQSTSYKERYSYVNNALNGDSENFFGSVAQNSGGALAFNVFGVDFSVVNTSIDISFQGFTEVAHQTKVTINGVDIGVLTSANYDSASKQFEIPTSVLHEGFNIVNIKTLNGPQDVTLFNGLKVNYQRRYLAQQNQLSFYVPNFKASSAGGFASPNIRVFDTTNSDSPLLISGLNVESSNGTYRVNVPSNRGRVMFAVEDSAILQPFSIVQNSPSTLSTAAQNGEMIIVSYKDWLTQAEDWANYRRAQGMTVKVVNVDDIFDEFSYGVLKPDAMRDFLQYAKNNWQTAPKYVLFLGDATYDPRNYLGNGNFNFIPTRLVDTIYTETGSDDTLADFNNDGLAEIAVGRIPARNAATVTTALNKVIAFEQNVSQGLNRGAIFASDLPNGYDFAGLSDRLRDQLPSNIPRIMINRALPDANTQLVDNMNSGKFLVNYSGHGAASFWAASGFFSNTHAGQLTNGNNLSIFTMLTCLNGYFIQSTDSLAEVLLKNPTGGAVSAWASSGLTTPDIQEVMATRFYNQIAAGNITRIGDLVNDAKSTINFGRDVRLSWVLLGDPTMKVK